MDAVGLSAPRTNAPTAQPTAAGQARLDAQASADTFMKLLVAQLRFQNPTQPADGTAFVTQLAQFSELEQLIGVRQSVDALRQTLSEAAKPAENNATPAPTQGD